MLTNFFFPILVICAVISLVDGILTLRYGKYLSSFILFPKQHLTIDTSDVLSALEKFQAKIEYLTSLKMGSVLFPLKFFEIAR